MKKTISILMACILLSTLLTGCTIKTKTYTSENLGLSVELPTGMIEKDYVNLAYCMQNLKVVFSANTIPKNNTANINSIDDFFNYFKNNLKKDIELKESDNLKYFIHEETAEGKDYFYVAALVEFDNSFVIGEFACLKKEREKYEDKFIEWAKTIKQVKE